MKGSMSKKTKDPPKRPNRKGNIKFSNPSVARSISNKERGGPPEKMLCLEEPSPTATAHLEIETTCDRCNAIKRLYNLPKLHQLLFTFGATDILLDGKFCTCNLYFLSISASYVQFTAKVG
jgi:hypothetical protein